MLLFSSPEPFRRREFLGFAGLSMSGALAAATVEVGSPRESIPEYLTRTRGGFDQTRYRQLLGAANAYKEGDEASGVAAPDEASRSASRSLLSNTRISYLTQHSVYEDSLSRYIDRAVDATVMRRLRDWTFGRLKTYLLSESEADLKLILPGLPSDVIACVVKLMSNAELVAVSSKVFHPLPGSRIGAKGYMGARIQPNSPTDNVDDIQWQVFNGFAYAVGDVVLGTNPVSSDVNAVLAIENALSEILEVFKLQDAMPQCVLAHIDVQAEAERKQRGSTALWFQSLAGVADANATFDISVEKMVKHAATRNGPYGLYFETGQGADATNGHGKGFDIVMHESRKYGFARALKREVGEAQRRSGRKAAPWVHVNDVAGFIGPEVFRTREQLVRCCLEDLVMGKLHGLTIGLDICATLHMDIGLDDLDWCIEQVMPANPAYLMALPTKNDPMLSYLTTGFQDHVRVREKFGYKVNDAMWAFFQTLGVIDAAGRPGPHFGRPDQVYLHFRRRKGDTRTDTEILDEAQSKMKQVRARGVEITEGHGRTIWSLQPSTETRLRTLYADARRCLWAELPSPLPARFGAVLSVQTVSKDRQDYILHPPTGETLSPSGIRSVAQLTSEYGSAFDVQIVISDGLNALSLTDEGHIEPYLATLAEELKRSGFKLAPRAILVRNGRVRAGYRIGEMLFGKLQERSSRRNIVHVIGERPGSGHHAFSAYLTSVPAAAWAETGRVDHNLTRVISGIADTSLDPRLAATETVRLLMPQG